MQLFSRYARMLRNKLQEIPVMLLWRGGEHLYRSALRVQTVKQCDDRSELAHQPELL